MLFTMLYRKDSVFVSEGVVEVAFRRYYGFLPILYALKILLANILYIIFIYKVFYRNICSNHRPIVSFL